MPMPPKAGVCDVVWRVQFNGNNLATKLATARVLVVGSLGARERLPSWLRLPYMELIRRKTIRHSSGRSTCVLG